MNSGWFFYFVTNFPKSELLWEFPPTSLPLPPGSCDRTIILTCLHKTQFLCFFLSLINIAYPVSNLEWTLPLSKTSGCVWRQKYKHFFTYLKIPFMRFPIIVHLLSSSFNFLTISSKLCTLIQTFSSLQQITKTDTRLSSGSSYCSFKIANGDVPVFYKEAQMVKTQLSHLDWVYIV